MVPPDFGFESHRNLNQLRFENQFRNHLESETRYLLEAESIEPHTRLQVSPVRLNINIFLLVN